MPWCRVPSALLAAVCRIRLRFITATVVCARTRKPANVMSFGKCLKTIAPWGLKSGKPCTSAVTLSDGRVRRLACWARGRTSAEDTRGETCTRPKGPNRQNCWRAQLLLGLPACAVWSHNTHTMSASMSTSVRGGQAGPRTQRCSHQQGHAFAVRQISTSRRHLSACRASSNDGG